MAAAGNRRREGRGAVLLGLQASNPSRPMGSSGTDGDPILLSRFRNHRTARQLAGLLSAAGLGPTKARDGKEVSVYVPRRHRAAAFEMLDDFLRHQPDRRPRGLRRLYDAAILWFVVCSLAAPLLSLSSGVAVAVAFWATGVSIGAISCRLRRNRLLNGNYQFSVLEMFAVTADLALLVLLWQFALFEF